MRGRGGGAAVVAEVFAGRGTVIAAMPCGAARMRDRAAGRGFACLWQDPHVLIRIELASLVRVVHRVREEDADEEDARDEDERIELAVVLQVHEERDDERCL